jgi:hypothetical protein
MRTLWLGMVAGARQNRDAKIGSLALNKIGELRRVQLQVDLNESFRGGEVN